MSGAEQAGGVGRPAGLAPGDEVEVEVGPVAHGGHCVARHEGQVLFVRHALPGERVRARVTDLGPKGRFVRADAVDVLEASPDRVTPPCPWSGPGACGGCDLQHVALPRQRSLKAEVVREQLQRLAGLDVDVVVEPVPGDDAGLDWRTRVEFAVGPDGRAGLRRHRSHEVVAIDHCRIAAPGVDGLRVTERRWEGVEAVDTVAPSVGEPLAVALPVGPDDAVPDVVERVEATWGEGDGAGRVARDFTVSARGFWQVHPGAGATFVTAVMDVLAVRPGERALDLYAGVGLFAAALGEAVGPTGQVVAVESDPGAVERARAGMAELPWVLPLRARVDDAFGVARASRGPSRRRGGGSRGSAHRAPARSPLLPTSADVVVLDPPRTGAGPAVVREIAALAPRAIAYVACDPAALARDTAALRDAGYRLVGLRAFDAFPMTHHVECVAHFAPEVP
ncbi:class I SAM-dependent RNA methyltransferase [Phycicoccus duodecadis]|uniref:23S rRNA m(5)U-1939 methyltransferase n=1 Tax=Phycicoccus duodecadis TaxID=173053 RepID=A0A2N3YFC4_9MICO|nr:TRAM domain-containing protein [Phycicoccus duodecadis]PKW25545.1 23S rRNA m(5)U-1939 methyltransferase [Phycicoccus duodecadis]